MKQVLAVVGNRSELARLAPALRVLRDQYGALMRVHLMHTGEKTQMVWSTGALFGLVPQRQHALSEDTLTYADLSWQISNAVGHELDSRPADLLIVQGSSLSSTLAAQQAFLRNVPVVHVDSVAGHLVDGSSSFIQSNRRMLSAVASFRCVPNRRQANGLRTVGYPAYEIGVTGSTAVEAARMVLAQTDSCELNNCAGEVEEQASVFVGLHDSDTTRETSSELGFALANLAHDHPTIKIRVMTSLGLCATGMLFSIIGSLRNVEIVSPSDYYGYLKLLGISTVVLTNSEDVAEEALALNRPVVFMQEEVTEKSTNDLFGTKSISATQDSIVNAIEMALTEYSASTNHSGNGSASKSNVIGDGKASLRIVRLLSNWARNRVLTSHSFEPFGARLQQSLVQEKALSTAHMH